MGPSRETLRLVRLTGLFTWLLVATPPAFEGMGEPDAFRVWLALMAAFATLFAWTTAHLGARGRAPWVALAGQSACVIGMSAIQYHGLEGTLLVLVSLELGLAAPRHLGLPWIALQSLGMAWAIQHHWALRPALMFAPPYVGFQVLTFLMVHSWAARPVRGNCWRARTPTSWRRGSSWPRAPAWTSACTSPATSTMPWDTTWPA